jgi:hypothetical protein
MLMVVGCSGNGAVPGVYLTPTLQDFGTVLDQDMVEGKFAMSNTTAKTVQIVNTRVSCGCTDVHLSDMKIEPGQSIDLSLKAHLRGRYGLQTFEATVYTDSTSSPVLQARLSGHVVVSDLSGTLPASLGAFFPGAMINSTVTIPAAGASAVAVRTVVQQLESPLQVSAGRGPNKGGLFALNVSGRAPSKVGRFSIETHVTAAGGDWKDATVLIEGVVMQRWKHPDQIYLGMIPAGKTARETIRIEDVFGHSGARRLQNVQVSVEGAPLDASAIVSDAGDALVSIAMDHGGKKGAVASKLKVRLFADDSQSETIQMSVFAFLL